MARRPRTNLARLGAIASVAAAFACLPAAAGADEVVVVKRDDSRRSIERYWTPERMERARPLEAVREAGGEIGVRRGAPEPFNHPAMFDSGRVPDPAAVGNAINGKLFGKIKGVGGYECSATAVDAANRNLIMTAGHCVAEPANRKLAEKLAFVPAYEDEARPFGTWVFDRIVVLRSWRRKSNFNFDFSAVKLAPQGTLNLQDAVGGAAVATGLPVRQTYRAIGYPANFDDGQTMRYCESRFQGYDPHPIAHGPRPIAMGCDMGFGASGGGWFVDGALNSVTSFGYDNHPDISYGPYFGSKTAQVYAKGAR
jgi:hypothetical protein